MSETTRAAGPVTNETEHPTTDANATGPGRTTQTNATEPGPTPFDPGWPALQEATIRPGVRIEVSPLSPAGDVTEEGCTANFVFSSPDNRTLYMGSTSHCLAGRTEGDRLAVAGVADAGTIVYCSYMHVLGMDTCAESVGRIETWNDFALIEIAAEHRDKVHPAILHWGGPTGLASDPAAGDKAHAYANSYLIPHPALARMEGYVWDADAETTVLHMVRLGVPGDSGSPVVRADGQAIGHLMGPQVTVPGAVWAANLGPLLESMSGHTGLEVRLKTWGLLATGSLP